MYGSIAYIAGDNLNSHMIGGFNSSFGPKVYRPCRYCFISNTDLQQVVECDQLECRTREMYDEHVRIVAEDP
jgi:hypothetical protein